MQIFKIKRLATYFVELGNFAVHKHFRIVKSYKDYTKRLCYINYFYISFKPLAFSEEMFIPILIKI